MKYIRSRPAAALALALAAGALAVKCGSTKTTEPSAITTHFQGTLAGTGGQSGTLDITVQSATAAQAAAWPFDLIAVLHADGPTAATGTLTLVTGGTASLAGSFNPATKALDLSGGGWALTGTISNATLAGTFTGPAGTSGAFSSLNATTAIVTVYCGTFQAVDGTGNFGSWNLAVAASGAASGIAFSEGQPAVILTGQVSGSTINLTLSDGGTGTGTIGNGVISGTGNNGKIFVGSTSSCNLPSGTGGGTPPTAKTYVGTFSGQMNVGNFNSPGDICATLFSFVGSMSITLDQPAAATLTGTAQATVADTIVTTGPCGRTGGKILFAGIVSGTAANLTITGTTEDAKQSWSFSGSLSGNVISGTVTRTWSQGFIFGSTTFGITLR